LSLKFASYPDDLALRLSNSRFETLERMVKQANEEHCDLFVVAGDLFDNLRVSRETIQRAAKILGQFDRLTLVLPGNHDYASGQQDDLWKTFSSTAQDRVLVLSEWKPYPLQNFEIDACVYPAP